MSESAQPQLSAILAMASNRVIGKDGDLPWHLPEDLKWFKKITTGYPIIMGRKTMESIGRPLPKRRNIVVSRSLSEAPDGYELASNCEELPALLKGEKKGFVIGGAGLLKEMLTQLDEFYLSYIFHPYEGDVFLPEFEDNFTVREVLYSDKDFELRHYIRSAR